MRLGLSQVLRPEQRLIQSPQMIQAMQVLQYPLVELRDRIDMELEENALLDRKESDRVTEDEPRKDEPSPEDVSLATFEQLEEFEKRRLDRVGPSSSSYGGDGDAKLEALANSPDRSETLYDHLLFQIALDEDLEDDVRERVEFVIYSLDGDGRLHASDEEIAAELQCSTDDALEAVEIVRSLDPAGVGARTLPECLLLQLDRLRGAPDLARTIVRDHLENLSMNRLPRIARETGSSVDEVKEAIDFLRGNLHPHPGAPYGDVVNQAITPDVVVEEIDGRLELRVEKEGLPDLQLSPIYRRLLKEAKDDPKVLEYLRKKIEGAKWFIDAIHQRQSTIQRIASAVVERQAEFLRKGIRYLKPLRMQDIADEVGVHISTVSRAISGKYIQTPQGIFDMKRFFSAGTRADSGELVSQQAVKQKLKEIVEAEDTSEPLSDDAIVQQLEQHGIHIARRTVTKYRKALGIPSSTQRKAY
ncbi:MAG: RNA polymerase factor sigma-54 [Planctomycetes bacterium]|nr:RNA polymerase factor sigma-54 [Planctomycetota bacterium]